MRNITPAFFALAAFAATSCFDPVGNGEVPSTSVAATTGSTPGNVTHTGQGPGTTGDTPTAPDVPTSGPGLSTGLTATADETDTGTSGPAASSESESSAPMTSQGPDTGSVDSSSGSESGDPELCGNGIVNPSEECDDGFDANGMLDGCNNECERSALFAFVTSQVYIGSMLDAELVDDACATLGNDVLAKGFGDKSTFKAWFSVDAIQGGASERVLSGKDLPILRLDLEKVSDKHLGAGNLILPISVDESGTDLYAMQAACQSPASLAWTMTSPTGKLAQPCAGNLKGTVGTHNSINSEWTAACIYDCMIDARLYCIEVLP